MTRHRSTLALTALAVSATLVACGGGSNVATAAGVASSPPPPSPSSAVPASPTSKAASPHTVPRSSPRAAVSTALPALRLRAIGTFVQPVWVAVAPGDRQHLFVVQKTGMVIVIDGAGRKSPTPLLDLTGQVSTGGEQGLLSIAFSPRYLTDHLVYVDYTDVRGDTRVVLYRVSGLRVTPSSRRQVLFVDQPYANHNGGLLLFDRTGMLLIGLGDGGSGGDPQRRAQRLDLLLGKILRIDPRGRPYAIPSNNPFVGPVGARGEIWAYGLRNPWRFTFDRVDNALYVADVGQNKIEELNVVPATRQFGANYGWSRYEGRSRLALSHPLTSAGPLIFPVVTYPHSTRGCSITGGEVYRGSALPALRGTYLYGDFCLGNLLALPKGSTRPVGLGVHVAALSSFATDANGAILVLSLSGTVSRLVAR